MKKCVLVCLFLVFIFPTSNALSVDFQWAWMWSDHSKDINGVTDYRMIIDVGVNSDSVTVTLNLPEYDEHIQLDPWGPNPGSPGYFDYGYVIWDPPPGDVWETPYQFSVSDGTESPQFPPAWNYFPMDFVDADISGGIHPTITWEPVEFADRYTIRLFDPVTWERLLQINIDEDGSTSYSYQYLGNLFEENEQLIIRVAARDYDGTQMVNRSRVDYMHIVNHSNIDGISDEEEDGAPNNGDGNDDGTLDSEQDNVASFKTYDDKSYLTLETPSGTTIMDCNSLENPSPSDYPEGVNFDFGFFTFTIAGINNGDNVTATLYLPDGYQPDTYYKYGGTPENPVPHWYEFMYDGETGAEIDGNVITIHFVDGKRGDDDLSANGSVVDDGGPGVISTSPPPGTSGGGGGGGGGGCFINSLRY